MSADFCDVLKQGLVRIKGKHLRMWKSKWLIMRSPSSRGPLRLEKYSDEKSSQLCADDSPSCVPLTDVANVQRLPSDGRSAIQIMFESQTPFIFYPENETESANWLTVLTELCTSPAMLPGGTTLPRPRNEISQNIFHVYLLPTPNLTAHGECILKVASHDLQLLDSLERNCELTRWPLCALRRYGRDATKFTIETGRSSPTGEGIFVFNSYQTEQIYQSVHRASLTIAETYRLGRSMQDALSNNNTSPLSPVGNQSMFPMDSLRSFPPYVNVPHNANATGVAAAANHLQRTDRRPLPPVPSQT